MWNTPDKAVLDEIPRLYSTEDIPLQDKTIYQHFFIFGCDWFIAEYDGNDLMWGFVILNQDHVNAEWGYVSYRELKDINVGGIEVTCDTYWESRKASEVEAIRACHF